MKKFLLLFLSVYVTSLTATLPPKKLPFPITPDPNLPFSRPTQQFASKYVVNVKDQGEFFVLNIQTASKQNTMCALVILELQIMPPNIGEHGSIFMKIGKDPNSYCLMAFGPHRGSFTFQKGAMPNLPYGAYELVINNRFYGILQIASDTTLFKKTCSLKN